MIAYNNQDYRVFELCPSSKVLSNTKFWKLVLLLWEAPTLLGPYEGANINQ
jgi:hypothetical protein